MRWEMLLQLLLQQHGQAFQLRSTAGQQDGREQL
jgi:hypothetical protein